jgi:hypothetical protein
MKAWSNSESESGSRGSQGGGGGGYEPLRSCATRGQDRCQRGASGAALGSSLLAFSSRSL